MRRPTSLALLLALALLAAHGPVLVGARTWSDRSYVTQVIPAREAAVDAIADGRLPGWWDRAGLGAPLWSEPAHAAAYPGWWPAAIAPGHAPWIFDVLALLHVLWAGLGVALLARRLGADDLGALVAGAWFGVSDVATGAMVGGAIAGVAHLPWAAWAADVMARADGWRPLRRGALALAASLAAIVLAGAWTLAIDGALLAAAWVAVRALHGRARALGAVGVAAALGAGIAAIALVPALASGAAPPGAGASGWRPFEMLFPHAGELGAGGGGVFVGGAALLFAIAAAITGGEGRRGLGAIAAVFAVATVLGPAHAAAAAVVGCALAGVGFAQLAARRPEPQTLRLLAGAAGGLALLVAIGAIARPMLAHHLDHGDLDAAIARVDRALGHAVAAAAVAVAALALVLAARRRGWPAAVPAAGLLVLAHGVIVARLAHPTVPRADLDPEPALLRSADTADLGALRAAGLPPRIYRPEVMPGEVDGAPDPVRAAEQTLEAATATRWSYAAARYQAPGRQRAEDLLWSSSAVAGARMFDRFAIELALVPSAVTTPGGMTALGERGEWAMVTTGARRSRAFLAAGWRWFPSDVAAARAMFPLAQAPPLPLDTVARVGAGDDRPGGGDPVACAVRTETPERSVVHCEGAGGMIVLLDAWAPGWSVTVDGEPARLERVDVAARGVEVPPGAHAAVFTYRAPGLALGRWITLASLVAAVALGLLRWRPHE